MYNFHLHRMKTQYSLEVSLYPKYVSLRWTLFSVNSIDELSKLLLEELKSNTTLTNKYLCMIYVGTLYLNIYLHLRSN